MSLETLLEYLRVDFYQSFLWVCRCQGWSWMCVCLCEVHCKWLWSPLIFKSRFNFPQLSPPFPFFAFHALSLTTWTLLDVCQLLAHTTPSLHAHTHSPPAVNSPMCGQPRLKIVLLSLRFQNIRVCARVDEWAHTCSTEEITSPSTWERNPRPRMAGDSSQTAVWGRRESSGCVCERAQRSFIITARRGRERLYMLHWLQ